MKFFAAATAAWWLVAEAGLLLMVEWSWRYVESSRVPRLVSKTGIFVVFSAAMGLAGLYIRICPPLWWTQSPPTINFIYYQLVWNALCTLWVAFEIAIVVYISRIVRALEAGSGNREAGSAPPGSLPLGRSADISKPLLPIVTCILVALFIVYHVNAYAVIVAEKLNESGILALAIFYIRICGLLWVAIEFAVAYWLIRGRALVIEQSLRR